MLTTRARAHRPRRPLVPTYAVWIFLLTAALGSQAFGQCVPANCDDGNACTVDVCLAGTCRHAITICDDSNACTADGCNPATGCTHTPISCADNNVCTTDACDQDTGCIHQPLQCPNPSPTCLTAGCDPASGCVLNDILCDDGTACTEDVCVDQVGCVHTPIGCFDNDVCTFDVCDPVAGCRFPPNLKCIVVSPLTIKAIGTISSMAFKRKGGMTSSGPFVKVTLQDLVVTSRDQKLVKEPVKLKVVLSGDDAGIASLLYPVVALGAGAGALDTLRAQGYDVSVTGDVPSCQSQLLPETCSTLAMQLSKAIDGTLALGDVAERDAFRQAAQALGYPPDNCVFIP